MTDFATRAYNHSFHQDAIVRDLLDTDFYKLLMLQFIWRRYKDVPVTFKLINRSKTVKLGQIIDINELKAQLNHVRTLKFKQNGLIWLAGNTFYGKKGMFEPEFIEFLRNLQLPDYELTVLPDGEYELTFSGTWAEVSLWEIYAMVIVNTLRNRALMKPMGRFELIRVYNEATHRLLTKLEFLKQNNVTGLADFGTRRRHDFLWQQFVVQATMEILGPGFIGTSNSLIAMIESIEGIGTNAHELPMVIATLAETDEELKYSQYKVVKEWQEDHDGNLRAVLPDTFGTTQFFRDAPDWVADSKIIRLDSKNPFVGGDEAINFFVSRGRDPMEKGILPSDGLDHELIVKLKNYFANKVGRTGYGFGTMGTNDFPNPIEPISLVCKVVEANGKSAVKLSDNFNKASGTPEAIARYRKVFGTDGVEGLEINV